jgi:hypothetical protein
MVTIASLWLPILLAAVAVYFTSSLFHMVLPHHKSDYRKLPDEDAVLEKLRQLNVETGNYHAPHAGGHNAMKDPAFREKIKRGPTLMMNLKAGGGFSMGGMLVQWFVYVLLVSLFAAYLCTRTLASGADYLAVFRIAGSAAFLAYAGAAPIESIWFMRNWSSTCKNIFDGLVYALLTGGFFGWLWPR